MKKLLAIVVILSLVFAPVPPAFAKERRWTGYAFISKNTDMSYWPNWLGSGVPRSGDELVFSSDFSYLVNPYNDFTGYTFSKVTFSDNAKTTSLLGNSIKLSGNVVNDSENSQTIDWDISLLKNVNINSGAGGHNLEIDGNISGGFGISKSGTSTLILGGANTYTGTTTISEGTLKLGAANAIPSGSAVTVGSGATLSLSGYSDTIASLSGAGWVNDNSATDATLTVGNAASTTFSGRLIHVGAGKLSLTKQGSGTLTLTGANTYTGATNVNAGVLNVRHNTATGTTEGGVTVASGAALQLQHDITVGAEALTLNGLGVSSDGALRNISGSNSWAGAITLGSASRINSDSGILTLGGNITGAGKNLTVGGSSNTTISGIIGTTTGTLIKDGGGILTLTGANTYTGVTKISAGTLSVNTIANGGTASSIGKSTKAAGNLVFNGGTLYYTGADAGTDRNFTISADKTATIDVASNNLTISGAAAATSGALTKKGLLGTLTLAGANLYTGATTIDGGTLALDYSTGKSSRISETAALISGGGILSLIGDEYTQVVASTTLNAGNLFVIRSGTAVLDMGLITVTDGATINFNAASIAKTSKDNNPLTGYLGSWATIGDGTLAKKDAAAGESGFIVAFDNYVNIAHRNSTIANVSTNSVRINSEGSGGDPTIALGAATTTIDTLLQNWTSAATVDTAGTTFRTNGIILVKNKAALTIGSVAGDGFLTSATASGDIDLSNFSNSEMLTVNAVIADNGGASDITKTGDGTVVFNGVNTYIGNTYVDEGTLTLNQSLLLSSGLIFGGESTVNLADGMTITPNITTDTDDQGILNFVGDGTASKQVGADNLSLEFVKISGAGKTVNFGGNVYATTLSFLKDSTAVIASGKSVIGAVDNNSGTDNWGTLTLSGGDQSVSGAIGTTNSLKTINVQSGSGATATFSDSVASQTVNASGAGKAQFNDALTAAALNISSTGETEINTASGITTTTFTGAGTLDLNDILTGDIAFGASGDGTVTLLGGKNITGTVNNTSGSANHGTLTLEAGGDSTVSGAVGASNTLKTINVQSGLGNTATFSDAVKAGIIHMTGGGMADFIGAVTATTMNITRGGLILNESSTLGTTTVSNGAHLQFKSDATILGTTILNLNGTGHLFEGALQNISGNNTWNGNISLKSSSLIHSYAGSLTISGTDITGAAKDLTIDGPGDVAINSTIDTTTGILIKNGSGTLTLSGANTYTGATIINDGILHLAGSLDNTGAVILADAPGATLKLSGSKTIGSLSGGGTLGGNVDLNGANTLTVGDANNTTYEGIISGTLGGITKQDAGILTITGDNTYTGVTKITAGTLSVDTIGDGGVAGSIGAATFAKENLIFDGGTLAYTGVSASTNRNFTINDTKTATIDVASNNLTMSGAADATSGALTKTGAGTLTLAGANSYTGTTTVSSGTLALDYSDGSSKISGTAKLFLGGGTISLINGAYTQTVASTTLSAGDSLITRSSGGSVLDMRAITVADGATINFNSASIAKTTTNNNSVTGMLGTWATFAEGGWAKKNAADDASGFIVAFDGYTDINAYGGTIANGANQVRIQYQGTSGNITLDSATTTINTLLQSTGYAATVDTAGKTFKADAIMVGDGKAGLTIGSAAGDGFLTSATLNGDIDLINYSNNELLTINAVIANNGGASKLTKSGDGTLVLNGINTYTGATLVSAGTLNLNQSLLTSSGLVFGGIATVNLADGKTITPAITTDVNDQGTLTLSGSGTISGQVGTAAAYLAEVNAETVGSTSTFASDVYATTINAGGAANFNGHVNTTTLNIRTDSTTTIASGKNLTGEVKASSGSGTLTLAGGDQTITGDIGTASDSWLGTINVGGSGTATFGGGILTKYFNVTGDRTVIFNDDVETLNDFTLSSDSIVTLADNKNMTLGSGGITSPSGQGTLTLSGEHTIDGNIGSTLLGNNGLKLITVGNGAVTINGDVRALAVNFAGDNELTMGSGYDITGAVTTTTDNTGTLTFAGSTSTGGNIGASGKAFNTLNFNGATTLSNDIYATDTNVKSGSTVISSGDRDIHGNLSVLAGGTLSIGSTLVRVLDGGAFSSADTSQINVSIASGVMGKIEATGAAATVDAGTNLFINVIGDIPQNNQFTILDGGAAGVVGTLTSITDDSARFYFTQVANADDLILLSNRYTTFAAEGTNPNARAVGAVLDEIDEAGATGDMLTVIDALDALSDAQIGDALNTMYPDVSSGAAEGSRSLASQGFTTISNRLGGARNGGASGSGISSGDTLEGVGVWMQALGSHMKQEARKGIEGYMANLFGTTVGADKVIDDHFRAGFAGSYGWARVKSKTAGSPSDDINSYQATIYGSFDSLDLNKARQHGKKSYEAVRSQVENSWYVDGMAAFTENNYDSRREIWVTPTSGRIAKAEHYGQQYSTNFETGYKFVFEKTKNLEVTPFVSLGYNYLYMNKYKEKGADSLNLTVNGEGFSQLEQGLGTKLAYPIVAKKMGTFIPSAKAAWLYDYIGDRFETTASFAGGGSSFNTQGAKPAKNGMLFGAELAFLNKGNMTVTGNWDIELKDQFMSNTYYGTVRYDF